ncbi:MAG: 16S rRNA (guanine(966)-N(2))-methyltransferase RsmD [Gammaproteobacteria bacterium]|nr:MAG: 16S rRNA (guanine(966)-N(2))-methyltransferase RsmD [Gammaproteobacteria bacterium]
MKAERASPKADHQNQLRIIGGLWRGRKLSFPDVEGLRPTGDRIRETLFNWLAPEIQGARCLDLFAGSGALGIEALSRGASDSLMIERDPKAAAQLKLNLDMLKAMQGRVARDNALDVLKKGNQSEPYHIVFVDPPFQLDLWQEIIDLLESGNWLADDATIYIESGRDANYHPPVNWQLHRDKNAGAVSYRLFYREQ